MDRLVAMRVFAEVATSGSFSATANKLDMSRAKVTRHVSEMEDWLQVRLLQRTTRRVTLTDAGEQALRRSQQLLELATMVEEETASSSDVLRGQLRLTSSMSFGHAHLAAAVAEFLELHPHLKVDLDVRDTALNLVESRIDLAIRISSEPDPLLIARPLAVCESVLVASPGYVKAKGKPKVPADLRRHQCLSYANFGRSVWRLSRKEEVIEVNVTSQFSANEATVLLHAALANGGIAMQPTYLANVHLQRGELVAILPAWQPPALTVNALYPSRKHLSPAVRALLDFLVDRFEQLRW